MVTRGASARRTPQSVAAGVFKAKCLALMDKVEREGASITITKRGRPVAMLSPVRVAPGSGLGFARGEIEILDDIVSPLEETWEAAT